MSMLWLINVEVTVFHYDALVSLSSFLEKVFMFCCENNKKCCQFLRFGRKAEKVVKFWISFVTETLNLDTLIFLSL